MHEAELSSARGLSQVCNVARMKVHAELHEGETTHGEVCCQPKVTI